MGLPDLLPEALPAPGPAGRYPAELEDVGIDLEPDPETGQGPAGRPLVAVDSSVLLGRLRRYVAAAAHLGYIKGYWSTWIVAEFVRKRTEWVANRAVRDGCDVATTRLRLEASRERVNLLIAELSQDLNSIDYRDAPFVDLGWLADPDDRPVMQTALAARAEILVSDNTRDFPPGEIRNGVRIMTAHGFLDWLYRTHAQAESDIRGYLGE